MTAIARIVLITLCIAISVPIQAQPAQQPDPIETLRQTVMTDAELFGVYLADPYNVKQISTAQKGKDDLKALVAPALRAAKGNADLKTAIKTFYIAADAYFESAFTSVGLPTYQPGIGSRPSTSQVELTATQAKLKADLDSKNAALQLEMQLAAN